MAAPKSPQRVAALTAGRSTYFTGKPCKHGHVANRHVSDNSCLECRRIFKEGYREQARAYAQRRRDEALARDPEGTRARWAEENRLRRELYPEAVRAVERKHSKLKRQRYPQRKRAETRARQASKIQRTPPWVDLLAIREIYEQCPEGKVVDHIIPLRGKLVSGLHVAENLQYLTQMENLEKGNTYVIE